jgi:hypothetical protein
MRNSNRSGPTDHGGGRLPEELADLGELADVEELLRTMPLRRPGATLDARVRATLRRDAARRGRLGWLAAAAAVAIAAGVTPLVWQAVGASGKADAPRAGSSTAIIDVPGAQPSSAPVTRAVYPASSSPPRPLPGLRVERTVDRVTDEGIVGRLGDMPLQRYRRQSVRQVWLIDPQQGTRVGATVPRDEIVVVGVRPF